MEKNKERILIDAKKIMATNDALAKAQYNDIEIEKKAINEELERNKRYLIEEVLHDGEDLLAEIERRERKSLWSRFIDFIFK